MNHPLFWSALTAVTVAGLVVRLVVRRPLAPSRATGLTGWEAAVGAVVLAVLVFHCGAMFFAAWVDLVPFLRGAAAAVRNLDSMASQVAYWLPATTLVVVLRRVWPPALVVLIGVLAGVGVTMFWPFALTTHLAWIAAAVVTITAIAVVLVRGRPRARR